MFWFTRRGTGGEDRANLRTADLVFHWSVFLFNVVPENKVKGWGVISYIKTYSSNLLTLAAVEYGLAHPPDRSLSISLVAFLHL